jgi:hypothetical protein
MQTKTAAERWNYVRASAMVCSECHEPAESHTEITIEPVLGEVRHEVWTHEDGEPLCPVMSSSGYISCDPMPASEVPNED